MVTLAFDRTRQLARDWENLYPSAVLSGIVGDPAHQARGEYHISIEDNPAGHWSVTRPDDKAPPGTWSRRHAAAVDMSMNAADMRLCTTRVRAVHNDRTDPRRRYLNAVNGWLGSGDAQRYDFYANTVSYATPDHKWHVHLEIRRRYANDATAMRAILSMLKGESKARYIASTQPKPPAQPPTTPPPPPRRAPVIYQYLR